MARTAARAARSTRSTRKAAKAEAAPVAPLTPVVDTPHAGSGARMAFDVTRGEETKRIEANNQREAIRKYEEGADPSNLTTTAKAIEVLGEPQKHRYRVTWGDESKIVEAVHEDDAWSQFVGDSVLATDQESWRHPRMHAKVIERLDDGAVELEGKPVEGKKAKAKVKKAAKARVKRAKTKSAKRDPKKGGKTMASRGHESSATTHEEK